MIIRAFSLLANRRIALFWYETATFTPGQHFVNWTTQALKVLIAVNQFLAWKFNSLRPSTFADSIFGCWQSGKYVAIIAVLGNCGGLTSALGILLTPVVWFGNGNVFSLLGLAWIEIRIIRKSLLEKLLSIRDGPVCKEFIWGLSEPMALTIMYKHGTLIDNGHLGKALLRVHESVNECKNTTCNEKANHGMVLAHVLCWLRLFTRSSHHGFTSS